MTQQIGTWRVQYRPGDWIVLSGPTSLVVLQPASGEWSELVTILWEQVVASATIADLAGRLTAYGVDSMPSFAAVFWGADGLHTLVRGEVSLTDLATGGTVAQGADVVTWSEVGLSGVDHLEIVLPSVGASDPRALLLPLVVGAVSASSIILDARSTALISSPQQLVPAVPESNEVPVSAELPEATEGSESKSVEVSADGPETEQVPDGSPSSDAVGEIDASSTEPASAISPAPSTGPIPSVLPPITAGAGALGTQGYLGTESVAESQPGADTWSEPESESADQPDTERFDFATLTEFDAAETSGFESSGFEAGGSEAPGPESGGVHENENADTELMYLPVTGASKSPGDDDTAGDLADDDENAHTELMFLPPVGQAPDLDQAPGLDQTPDLDQARDVGLTATEELTAAPARTEEADAEVPGWPSDPDVSGLDGAEGTAGRSLIMAVMCPRLHPNPPPAGFCRVCGEAITPQGPRLVSRPVLARLRGPGGDTVELDRPVRIGRAPSPDGDADQHLMTVISPSQDISRTHLEVAPDGWQVIATDLHSTNGTLLVSSDGGIGSHALSPGEPVVLELGAVLELGDGVTIVVDPPPEH